MLLLPFGTAPDGKAWATGQAVIADGATPLSNEAKQKIVDIHDQLGTDRSSALWRELDNARTRAAVTFAWDDSGGPAIITLTDFVPQDRLASLFRFDW